MINLNIQVINYVKTLADNNRCAVCHRSDGQRLRYRCGHSTCVVCITTAEECQICITRAPSSGMSYASDDPMTQRAENATSLLNACQKLINADVYQKQRLSEQLRIEKEVFPKCIQAPVKYENKRKSSFGYSKNKENNRITVFPGEQVSQLEDYTMENSVRYVEQWLSRNKKDLTRTPLGDLSVNTSLRTSTPIVKNIKKQNITLQTSTPNTNRKRSHFKATNKVSQDIENNFKKTSVSKRIKKDIIISKSKQDNDESGICMDHDLVVIEDTLESVIDKDKKAWLAVLEANENESTSLSKLNCTPHVPHSNNKVIDIQHNDSITSNVPFYKKSAVVEICKQCTNEQYLNSKEVKISVDTKDFSTTIQIISNIKSNKTMNSVLVQTDISETVHMNVDKCCAPDIENKPCKDKTNCEEIVVLQENVIDRHDTASEDLFKDDVRISGAQMKSRSAHVTIEDSDSDMEASGPLSVTVDVHRTCDQLDYGVLSEIVDKQHCGRLKRGPRGISPTSTNSSDKENFDPNRKKSVSSTAKKCGKK